MWRRVQAALCSAILLASCRGGFEVPHDPCVGVTCSGHGRCGQTSRGEVRCFCDPEHHNISPTSCVPDTAPFAFTAPTPVEDALVPQAVVLAGTCSADCQLGFEGDLLAPAHADCELDNTFARLVELSLPDGPKLVRVVEQDAEGGEQRIERHFVLDATAPAVAFSGATPVDGATLGSLDQRVQGSCEDGLRVGFEGDLDGTAETLCEDGGFDATLRLTPAEGSKRVTALQVDTVGNRGEDSRTWALPPFVAALAWSGSLEIAADVCAPFSLSTLSAAGTLVPVDEDTDITLSGGGYGDFYADPACASGAVSSALLAAGQASVETYYMNSVGGLVRLQAAARGLAEAEVEVQVTPRRTFIQPGGGGFGALEYRKQGATFAFRFIAEAMTPQTQYTLLYFPERAADPTSGQGLICLETGVTDSDGRMTIQVISGGMLSLELDTDLPAGQDDNFYTRGGARIMLAPSAHVDCAGSPTRMLHYDEADCLMPDENVVFNDTEVTHLVAKDAAWTPLPDSYYGELHFSPLAPSFDFTATFRDLDPGVGYTLVYYHDPWPGHYLSCLASGTSASDGALVLSDSQVIAGGLPMVTDPNYSYAKVWLVRSADVDCAAPQLLAFNIPTTVFDYSDGLVYADSDRSHQFIAGLEGSVTTGERCKISSSAWQSVSFQQQDGAFSLWLTVKPSATTGEAITGLSYGRPTGVAALALSVLFDSDGTIRAFDGRLGDYAADAAVSYSVGDKAIYRLHLLVDTIGETYSVEVLSGEDHSDWVGLAADYGFRVNQGSTSMLDHLAFQTPTGDSHMICGATLR